MTAPLPQGWRLTANAFNWTPDVVRAERDAADIAVGIVSSGVAREIELEAGQTWRGFPAPGDTEVDALRSRMTAAGGSISMVGASIDDWATPQRRRTDGERLDFLLPQLRAAHRVGAEGVRLPIGQAGPDLLRQILPHLHELDLVLYEEAQGQQAPDLPPQRAAFDAIAEMDDPRVRALVDISMLMPSLPPSYLERLRAGGVRTRLVDALEQAWRDPETSDAVRAELAAGAVPPGVHTLFMDMIVRFGRSDAADLREILPLVGAVHLKFWDLDDGDGRVSHPIREIARELAAVGFSGTLCSEWGGHAWLDDLSPDDATRAHLALARDAIASR